MRVDIVANKRDGVKTIEDLHIQPVSMHHIINDIGNWALSRLIVERNITRNWDEYDVDDEANQ
jgi:hypothetical protein